MMKLNQCADPAFSCPDTLISTNGFFGHLERSSHSISVSVIAGEGSEMETDYDYTAKAFAEDMRSPKEVGLRAAKRALSRLNSSQGTTGNFPVIFLLEGLQFYEFIFPVLLYQNKIFYYFLKYFLITNEG